MQVKRVVLLLQVAAALCASVGLAAEQPRVDASVHRALKRQGTVNILVTMRDETTSVLDSIRHESSFESRGAMIQDMVAKLETHASSSQAEITKLLAQESSAALASEVKSFWISNQVYFRDASFELVEKLSAMAGVADIREEMLYPLPALTATNETVRASPMASDNLVGNGARIEVSALEAGGVVIGSIDTGVRATHTMLQSNFRREFGWYDPEKKTTDPYDSDGHGTNTMGAIVGSAGVGVAPKASWITCRGCRGSPDGLGGCLDSDLLACAEFMLCPTDPTGAAKDCSKAPRVVNNSWGSSIPGNSFFQKAVDAWQQAGIIPVFSAGDAGSGCSTIGSPADYANVITVGAMNPNTYSLAAFSSRGPAADGRIKPEIVAPGTKIFTTGSKSDNWFSTKQGTSLAAAKVTGTIALLLTAVPTLSFSQVLQLLLDTTDKTVLTSTATTCSSTNDVFPNNMYGYGWVNADRAVMRATAPPAPGQCAGLNSVGCDSTFFCTWNFNGQNCQRWWS